MIWITIPTGQRSKQAGEVVKAWKDAGFKVFVYAWDGDTRAACADADDISQGPMRPFPVLQNWMAKQVWRLEPDTDAVICGADDLWPVSTLEEIEDVVKANPVKLIWVKDGCFNQQPTHPIATKGWWENHNSQIFSPAYRHNFCDTDLAMRCLEDDSIVKCFYIDGFDHRHWYKTGKRQERDSVYRLGEQWFQSDQFIFDSRFPRVNIIGKLQSVPNSEVIHAH